MTLIYPAILSGGSGTRLWPLSRASSPKQLRSLVSDEPVIIDTARRVTPGQAKPAFAPPTIICNLEHRYQIAEAFRWAGLDVRKIILESSPRNTAPAVAVAALDLGEAVKDALVLVLPSDHEIQDVSAFHAAIEKGSHAALEGHLVTFGIVPTRAETGYGYIEIGDALHDAAGVYTVSAFVEKPDPATAERYVTSGEHLWNAGIFLFRADAMLSEMRRLSPQTVSTVSRSIARAKEDMDFLRLDAEAFDKAPGSPVDKAVFERSDRVAVVRLDAGWSDIGSWDSLWEVAEKDTDGNAVQGDVILDGVRNSLVRSDPGRLVAAVGVEEIAIVAVEDAVLVTARDRAQDVKHLVAELERDPQKKNYLEPITVHRPWGWFKTIDVGSYFQVKHLTQTPGTAISLQYHNQRSEHWVVGDGTAHVTRGEEGRVLQAYQSTFIPQGEIHRVENMAEAPLRLIEVQCGSYLGEDDIVRLEDRYQRIKEDVSGS